MPCPLPIREPAIVASLALSLLSLAGCGDPAPAEDAAPRTVTAVAAPPLHPVAVAPSLELPGVVEARTRIELAFRVTGFVERFLVDEGDRVEQGQVLAELDRSDLLHERAAARASARRAAAQAAEADRTLARQEELFARESTSRQALDRAGSQAEMALAEAAEARARARLADERVAKAVLRAPVSGVVEARLVDAHELATAQRPVLVLTELDPLVVRASVADQQLGELARGAPAHVTSPLWPGRTFTASALSPSRRLLHRARPPRRQGSGRPSDPLRARNECDCDRRRRGCRGTCRGPPRTPSRG